MTCKAYVKEALTDIRDDSDFKNAVVHCLEFMAEKIDNPKYVPPTVLKAGEHTAEQGPDCTTETASTPG